MTVETATYISQLDPSLPTSDDPKSEGDNHLRLIKTVLQDQFPNFGTNAITPTAAEVNYLVGVTSGVQAQLNTKGAIAGQTWTGNHDFTGSTVAVATASPGDSSSKPASTAFAAALAFSAALPAQPGNARKFTKTDGSVAIWAYPELEVQLISTNTIAVPGVHYIITAACTLTLPASWATQDVIAVSNASGLTTPIVDFGSTKLRGSSPGSMTLDTVLATFKVVYSGNATTGLVPA